MCHMLKILIITCFFEVDHIFKRPFCAVGSNGYCIFIVPQSKKKLSCTGQILSHTSSHVCLSCSLDFGFMGQCSSYRNSFLQGRLLTVTPRPCSLLFNVKVMILVGSSGFFNHASTSVDWCYLYIIIHYGMSQ